MFDCLSLFEANNVDGFTVNLPAGRYASPAETNCHPITLRN